jgi:hypothetical protein
MIIRLEKTKFVSIKDFQSVDIAYHCHSNVLTYYNLELWVDDSKYIFCCSDDQLNADEYKKAKERIAELHKVACDRLATAFQNGDTYLDLSDLENEVPYSGLLKRHYGKEQSDAECNHANQYNTMTVNGEVIGCHDCGKIFRYGVGTDGCVFRRWE